MEAALIEAVEGGYTLLTGTSRLARRLLHAYRLRKIKNHEKGWQTPAVSSFNRWVRSNFDQLWEPSRPLSRVAALRLWEEAVHRVSLLEGLNEGPFLFLELQKAFDLLTRHGLNPASPPVGHRLSDWRREVSKVFLTLAENGRFVSWAQVLERLGEAFEANRLRPPEKVILCGFDLLSPIERSFLERLGRTSSISFWQAAKGPDDKNTVRVYATPEQECRDVCAEILRAWNEGKKRLGLVFFDPEYSRWIEQCFEELVDREERPPDKLRYNLTLGTPLSEHPLFQTALVPLRLLSEAEPQRLLSSLLTSPYVRKGATNWDEGIRRVLWPLGDRGKLERNLEDLDRLGYPVGSIRLFTAYRRRPLRYWCSGLERVWQDLSFPVCSCETDTLAKDHLLHLSEELSNEAGHVETDSTGALAWFVSSAQGFEVIEKTPETAGIQILTPIESRGLAFERLWVVGAHGRVLPEPVRRYPFLDPDEIRQVEGTTAEAQWESGRRNLSYLLASSPEVTLSRAVSQGEDEVFLPCPFLPDETGREKVRRTIDLWQSPPREWMRARWLREGLQGIVSTQKEEPQVPLSGPVPSLPRSLEVTEVETLLSCPFQFFASRLLKLEPLEEREWGLDPAERGTLIHRILKRFVSGLHREAPDWPERDEKALELLEKTVDAVLSNEEGGLFLEAERLRLLGDEQNEGLLKVWLREEQQRARDGWRFEAAEISFDGLPLGDTGLTVRGRVDRVDHHDKEGRILWDYKTGNVPKGQEIFGEMVRPQLPLYLLALKKGLLSPCKEDKRPVRAGYIGLKRIADVSIKEVKVPGKETAWEAFLPQWEEEVKRRLEEPLQGLFKADPKPPPKGNEGACRYCSFEILCDILGRDVQGGEEESDEPFEG